MKRTLFLFLLARLLSAAPTTAMFVPQGPAFKGVTEWSVTVCASEARTIAAGNVFMAAVDKFQPLTVRTVQARLRASQKKSPVRIALLVLEGAAWAMTAAQATQAIKIADNWRALAPTVAGAMQLSTNMINRENPLWQPGEIISPLFMIPAGGCIEAVTYSAPTSQKAFVVTVP